MLIERESLKNINSLHLPSERYSPVRRASDGAPNVKYQAHLEKLYNQALSQPGSCHNSLKQLRQECVQLQKATGTTDSVERQQQLQHQHLIHRHSIQVTIYF